MTIEKIEHAMRVLKRNLKNLKEANDPDDVFINAHYISEMAENLMNFANELKDETEEHMVIDDED